MTKRILTAAMVSFAPGAALAHPAGHDGLAFADLGAHLAGDPYHLLTLGGVMGAGLLAVAAAVAVRAARARRHPSRRR